MGSQKQLHQEKERPACPLIAPLSCWTQLLLSWPSAPLPFPSSCHDSLFNPFHAQVSLPLPTCTAQLWLLTTPLHRFLPILSPSPQQEKCLFFFPPFFLFFFSFSYSSLPCTFLQLKFTPGLMCAKHVPFHTPPPTHTYQLTNATAHQIECRHLLTVLVSLCVFVASLFTQEVKMWPCPLTNLSW